MMKGLLARLSPTARVIACSAIVSVAGGVFGYDTGSCGAISTMPFFELQFGILSPLVRGFFVAIILVPASISGIFAGLLSDYRGREQAISIGCLIFSIGSAISAGSNSFAVLILGRVIAGSGEGLFLSVIGVYICEISPIHLRGKMVLLIQLSTSGAIAGGFFSCYATVGIPSNMSWRAPFIIQSLTSLTLAIVTPFLYQSPRWLLSKGRRTEAEAILDLLAGPGSTEERREMIASGSNSGKSKFKDIFQKGVRGRTFLGVFLNVIQQLSGIDFVLYFAPLLFSQAGLSAHTAAFLASGVTGLVLVVTVLIGTLFIDQIGRRTLFLIGGVSISICLFMLGVLYATGLAKTSVGKWFVIGFIELFAVSFSSTWSLVVRLYSSEIQPSRTRGSATALGQGMNQMVNFVVAASGPVFLAESSFGPYFLYGAFTAFGTIVAFIYMPEVNGISLERIDNIFETSTYAVKWPSLVSRTLPRATELRQRRTSRNNSSTLPGETREEFRAQFKDLDVVASAIEE